MSDQATGSWRSTSWTRVPIVLAIRMPTTAQLPNTHQNKDLALVWSPDRVQALLRGYRVDCSTFSGNLISCFRALETTRCKKRVLQCRVLVGG